MKPKKVTLHYRMPVAITYDNAEALKDLHKDIVSCIGGRCLSSYYTYETRPIRKLEEVYVLWECWYEESGIYGVFLTLRQANAAKKRIMRKTGNKSFYVIPVKINTCKQWG